MVFLKKSSNTLCMCVFSTWFHKNHAFYEFPGRNFWKFLWIFYIDNIFFQKKRFINWLDQVEQVHTHTHFFWWIYWSIDWLIGWWWLQTHTHNSMTIYWTINRSIYQSIWKCIVVIIKECNNNIVTIFFSTKSFAYILYYII